MTPRIHDVTERHEPHAAGRVHRVSALDGLRGMAALVVVLHHCLLTWPAVAAQIRSPDRSGEAWWLTYSPLHLAWAGREAVVVFFILSGFVLVLPYLTTRSTGTWWGYLVRRLLRLYPPVAASLVVAALLASLFPREVRPGVTGWYARHDVDLTWSALVHDALLVDGAGMLNSVLWSLRYEVAFSLLLPVVVLAARRLPDRLAVTVPASLLLVAAGQLTSSSMARWLPIFLVGVVLARGRHELRAIAARVDSCAYRRTAWWALTVTAVGLLLAEWALRAVRVPDSLVDLVALPLVAAGGALVCFVALGWASAERAFSSAFLQWSGRISFSLYLVHEPVVVSVAGMARPGLFGVVLTVLAGGALSVALAVAFHRFVELPCQRWSRRRGSLIDLRMRPEPRRSEITGSTVVPRVVESAADRGLVHAR